jgi:hypothetical protein
MLFIAWKDDPPVNVALCECVLLQEQGQVIQGGGLVLLLGAAAGVPADLTGSSVACGVVQCDLR